jgi:hypothetical protein
MNACLLDFGEHRTGLVHCENQYFGLGAYLEDLSGGVQSVKSRHADIHDGNIRGELSSYFPSQKSSF